MYKLVPRLYKILFVFSFIIILNACEKSEKIDSKILYVGAIPDQDPEKLQRLYGKLAAYLENNLKVKVEYKPVIDYTAAVSAFRVGDLDLVWFGGLTGVQARLQVEDANAIAQRPQDAQFHSVFIAHKSAGLTPFSGLKDLEELKGKRFTFGSPSSTSGRLMPQYFMAKSGLKLDELAGKTGFSKSHDITLKLVESGSYEVGALNEQVWLSRVKSGDVDLEKVGLLWTTPSYFDYHWVVNSASLKTRFGPEFESKLKAALLRLDENNPEEKEILSLFAAHKFISTDNKNYEKIEKIGRQIGKIK